MECLVLYSADNLIQAICPDSDFEKVKKSLRGKAKSLDYVKFPLGKREPAEVIPLILKGNATACGGGHINLR